MKYLTIAAMSFARALDTVFTGLKAGKLSELQGRGKVTRYFYTGEIPAFLFKTPFSDQIVRKIRNPDINIGVESVYSQTE